MESFLYNNFLKIIFFLEILAVFVGIVLYKKYKTTNVKYFIYYLVYVFCVDRLGGYTYHIHNNGFLNFLKGTLIERNSWWFTIFWKIGGVLFFSVFFLEVLKNKLNKKILKTSILTFIVSSLICIIFNIEMFFVANFIFIELLGATLILMTVILYFLELLNSDSILTFFNSIYFYIATSILFFWLTITPLIFYEKYFTVFDKNYILLRMLVYLIANVFMYLMFVIGLIVSKPK